VRYMPKLPSLIKSTMSYLRPNLAMSVKRYQMCNTKIRKQHHNHNHNHNHAHRPQNSRFIITTTKSYHIPNHATQLNPKQKPHNHPWV
jgi:hypothetical protein